MKSKSVKNELRLALQRNRIKTNRRRRAFLRISRERLDTFCE